MASNKGKKKTKKVTEENKINEVKNVKIESKTEEKIEQKNEAETEKEVSEPKVRKVKKKTVNNIDDNSENKKENLDKSEENKTTTNETIDTVKKEEKKAEIVKKDSIEILEQEIKEKKNKRNFGLFNLILLLTFVLIFSTVFALLNEKTGRIVKGITIKDIDVSNLTQEEAKTKITEAIELEFMREADLYYTDDYTITIKPVQIESMYDIDAAVKEAYEYGRNENIVVNNYNILIASLSGKNIGMEFTYNEESLNSIVNDIASKIPGKVIDYNYSIEDAELVVTKGTRGVKVNTNKLKQDIVQEIESRNIAEIINNEENVVIKIEANETDPAPIDVNELYNKVYREPVDAYYETEPFKLYPEVDGIKFAISLEEAEKIISDKTKEEYIIPLTITKANKTVNDIGTEAFPYEISKYSTKYDVSNTNRSQNLKLASDKINGTVLMPGEEFSYNQVVGKRTVEAGYKNAKIYSNGQVVDGLGGGICQISSTLYNAVLLADLEITERRNHYFKTSYVPAGRDATVVWGSIDFKFKNTRTYPIKIESKVSSGIAEFKIHGIKEEKEYDIKILPVVTQTIPYGTQEIIDPTLMQGTKRTIQTGSSGCKVTTYVEKSLDGITVSKEAISSDSYKALTQIVHVAP